MLNMMNVYLVATPPSNLAPARFRTTQETDAIPFGTAFGSLSPITPVGTYYAPQGPLYLSQTVAAQPWGATVYPKPYLIRGRGVGEGTAPNLTTTDNLPQQLSASGGCGNAAAGSFSRNVSALRALVGL